MPATNYVRKVAANLLEGSHDHERRGFIEAHRKEPWVRFYFFERLIVLVAYKEKLAIIDTRRHTKAIERHRNELEEYLVRHNYRIAHVNEDNLT